MLTSETQDLESACKTSRKKYAIKISAVIMPIIMQPHYMFIFLFCLDTLN